jgi:hypothetical protein
LFADSFITVLLNVTCPSPPIATPFDVRTDRMVVA